jgi:steroid delta-isomerase-like uncharacterized protein
VSVEANKAIVRRYYAELWNRWELALIDELIAPDITFRGSLGMTAHGRDGFAAYLAAVRAAFPDFHNAVDELIGEGDRVVARLTYRGTHRGAIFELPPTGSAIEYGGIAIFRIAAGRIADGWVLGDTLSLLRQLGARAIPPA